MPAFVSELGTFLVQDNDYNIVVQNQHLGNLISIITAKSSDT